MRCYNIILTLFLLTLFSPTRSFGEDNDLDGIDDALEEQIAYKFAPVLHRHHSDKQEGLQNFDDIVENHVTVKFFKNRTNILGRSSDYELLPEEKDSLNHIHFWEKIHPYAEFPVSEWALSGTHGLTTVNPPRSVVFVLDNSVWYEGAQVGERPIYYHVYEEQCHFYLQYWYYFTMNDIQDQTELDQYHESDWEHVTIQLEKDTDIDNIKPIKVNFYLHEGGKTYAATHCWWSTSRNDTTYDSSKLDQGYDEDENRTHLHIWLAANSHASYNRFSDVYQIKADLTSLLVKTNREYYKDTLEYFPDEYDYYFAYDTLINLGEVEKSRLGHDLDWDVTHHSPIGSISKDWLGYQYRFGDDFRIVPITLTTLFSYSLYVWQIADWFYEKYGWKYEVANFLISFIKVSSFANNPPLGISREEQRWLKWEENFSRRGFGNQSETHGLAGFLEAKVSIDFVPN